MKNPITVGIIIGAATLALGLTACSAQPAATVSRVDAPAVAGPDTAREPEVTTVSSGTDRTVHPAESWGAPGKAAKVSRVESVLDVEGSPNIERIAKSSDLAVRGQVTSVSFTHVDGQPYTLSDVKVSEVLGGDATPGDLITVVQPGGFVPLRVELDTGQIDPSRLDPNLTKAQIDNMVNEHHWDGEEFPKVGDESVYFLTELTKSEAVATVGSGSLTGAWFRGWTDSTQFHVVQRNGKEVLTRDLESSETKPGDPDTKATISEARLEEVAKENID